MQPIDPNLQPAVELFVLPGGKAPERKTAGAVGYDTYLRAIVSPSEMDPQNPNLRKTLFDFERPAANPDIERHILQMQKEDGTGNEWVYQMDPHESVLAGIGFVTKMDFPLFYWVAPRSGLASRWGITVTNAPGTVDPDYRGEAGVLIYNRNKHPFNLKRNMRIAQIIFQYALIPQLIMVPEYEKLTPSDRGVGGFGSTGLK